MKLQNMTIIFLVIILPIILVVSYYMSLQIDTLNMQTSYNTKLLESTKEAIDAFEINTVQWNSEYSSVGNSKRRDVNASINTFITSFANNLGVGGASKDYILSYIPAIAYTMYDGFYIYSPAETKQVAKDDKGIAKRDEDGNLIYLTAGGSETKDSNNAATTYEHILKPYAAYTARYKNDSRTIDVTINYTLDNYIKVYGDINGSYEVKAGYLIDTGKVSIPADTITGIKANEILIEPEKLSEKVYYEGLGSPQSYDYVYTNNKTKIYFDGNTPFYIQNEKRHNLSDTNVRFKELTIMINDTEYIKIYQALSTGSDGKDNQVTAGTWYYGNINSAGNIVVTGEVSGDKYGQQSCDLKEDCSAINYYVEAYVFSKWVDSNLDGIKASNMDGYKDDHETEEGTEESFITEGEIFNLNDIESEKSTFSNHKREVIKNSVVSSLNQAITSYSRNTAGNYQLPVLSETDWDQILTNVSMITFVQDLPIGMKYYNNYAIATSTLNKEYVDPNEIYISVQGDSYYHTLYCDKIDHDATISAYRSIDYVAKSYEISEDNKGYYYQHEDLGKEACYYCLVNRALYNPSETNKQKQVYETALAREKNNINDSELPEPAVITPEEPPEQEEPETITPIIGPEENNDISPTDERTIEITTPGWYRLTIVAGGRTEVHTIKLHQN